MAEPSSDDPYAWDVAALTAELCGGPRPWAPANPQKRPDTTALAAALEEHELDGETFLSWDDVFGSHNDLFRDLGIVKAAHRMTIAKAIHHLKKRSSLYRKAKQQLLAEQASQNLNDSDLDVSLQDKPTNSNHHGKDLTSDSRPSAKPDEPTSASPLGTAGVLEVKIISAMSSPPTEPVLATSPEPPLKKRRLAPQLVSAEVRGGVRAPIPTAADDIRITSAYGPTVFASASRAVYLGKGALVLSDWVPRSSLRSSHKGTGHDEAKEFSWHRDHARIPAGRQLQVYRGMRRLLQANSESEGLLRDNIAPFVGHSPSPQPSQEDEILPKFGESDDEGYDSDTLREMEQEAASREEFAGSLDKQQVQHVLDDVIQSYIRRWNDEKLERYQRKAYSIWRSAFLKGRNQEILRSITTLAALEARIRTLVAEIHSQDWFNEGPLRRQARCLEASVEDCQYYSWLSEMLKGREPSMMPRATRPQRKKTSRLVDVSDEDGEFITSESELSEDNHPGAPPAEQHTGLAAASPLPEPKTSVAPGDVVDLAEVALRDTVNKSLSSSSLQDVVDLVTPDDSSLKNILVPEERFELTPEQLCIPFDRPQDIGEINVRAWEQYKDRERLTISFLWKKRPHWRNRIFQLVKRRTPDAIWNELIAPACKPGGTTSSVKNELKITLVRLFWQYAYCRVSTAIFTTVLGSRVRAEVPKERDRFEPFVTFLREHVMPNMPIIEPTRELTPKPKTTSVEDDGAKDETGTEDGPGSDIEMGNNDTPMSSRKKKKRQRPVIRDEAAEKLREEEKYRAEAMERRKAGLFQRMAGSKSITKEQARLIINVGKEGDDESGFISVSDAPVRDHGSIAARIKDHQIDGVRFMWDHLMANQGCLLAHTMGLGKTMQVITLLVAIAEASESKNPAVRSQIPKVLRKSPKILILCPAGLVDNWVEELCIWAPQDVYSTDHNCRYVDKGQNKGQREFTTRTWYEKGGILILGYDLFRIICLGSDDLADCLTDPDIVIADEAHRLKNRASKLAEVGSRIKSTRRVALTGTPLANNVGEFYSTIDWIAPNFLGPFKEFQAVYVEPIETGLWGDSTTYEFRKAKKMLAALEKTVAPKTHRLTTACLKEQLPAKIEFVVTAPMLPLQSKLYKLYISSLRSSMDEQIGNAQTFAVTVNLTLLCNHPKCFHQKLIKERQKRESVITQKDRGLEPPVPDQTLTSAFISEALKLFAREKDIESIDHSWKVLHLIRILDECRRVREKVLIFSQSIATLDYLDNLLRQLGRSRQKLTGQTDPKLRQNMVREFNSNLNQEVFLISTTAGGVGLNIIGANRVVIFDFKYNPVAELQAIGRAYRIGQTRKVIVYRFLAGGTFEKHLHNKAVFKQQLASRVVDKENPKRWSSKFGDLIRPLDEDVPREDLTQHVGRDAILDNLLADPVHQQGICSLLLTDTFEEEDPNDTALSAEERKEVESMIEMNRIRHTDPARYLILEQQLNLRQAAEQHRLMAESTNTHLAPTIPSSTVLPSTPRNPPAHGIPRTEQLSTGAQSSTAKPPTAPPAPLPPITSAQPQMPMTAAGASPYARGGESGPRKTNGRVSLSNDQSPGSLPQGSPVSSSPAPSRKDRLFGQMSVFEAKLIQGVAVVAQSRGSPPLPTSKLQDRAAAITRKIRELQVHRNSGFLPDKARWNELTDKADLPLFCGAVLDGKLSVDMLLDGDLSKWIQEQGFSKKAEDAPSIGGTKNMDPNHLSSALSRSSMGSLENGTASSSQAHEDMLALRHVADRRKKRPQLPTWANRAVEDGQ